VTTAVGFIKPVSDVINQQEHEISNCPSGELFIFACHYFGPIFWNWISSWNFYHPVILIILIIILIVGIAIEYGLITFESRWDCGKHVRPTVERINPL